jgi:hypothetical protein
MFSFRTITAFVMTAAATSYRRGVWPLACAWNSDRGTKPAGSKRAK